MRCKSCYKAHTYVFDIGVTSFFSSTLQRFGLSDAIMSKKDRPVTFAALEAP